MPKRPEVRLIAAVTSRFRVLAIAFEAIRFAGTNSLQRVGLLRSAPQAPLRLRIGLERLGTTFIKLGQALSVRRDVLPDAYVAALQGLQDHIASFPTAIAIQELERGLGHRIGELFAEFEPIALAAGSIAQVHSARLHDGRKVIVKIRRAGIARQIDRDMQALTTLTRVALVLIAATAALSTPAHHRRDPERPPEGDRLPSGGAKHQAVRRGVLRMEDAPHSRGDRRTGLRDGHRPGAKQRPPDR